MIGNVNGPEGQKARMNKALDNKRFARNDLQKRKFYLRQLLALEI